ncbi:unannotated protein [freshwater metagenome]|uniref:peptide-methionine (R)-S-oxide reductase n=1 Tax=freshwater metagenome TaxID=449393 RepID=A0A6J7DRL4_9ZZZZ|nr:peptide-methionine (R)-S-oxide reductase MsrB [Actinomycetota bacterium]
MGFFSSDKPSSDKRSYPIERTDEQWKELLTAAEYQVLRRAGTEPAWVGEYTDTKTVGVYRCRACQTELFRSETKFDSHCGWPSFFSPLAQERIEEIVDRSMGMSRTEVRCAACGSHLGHVFSGEGYPTPTDLRYCINSLSISLETETTSPSDQQTSD